MHLVKILHRPKSKCLAFVCLVIPYFRMTFDIFSLTLCIRLGLPHFMACGFFWYICDLPIDLTSIHLFHCAHGENTLPHMMWFGILSFPLLRMLGSMSCVSKLMFSWCHISNHYNNESILCLHQMVFALSQT